MQTEMVSYDSLNPGDYVRKDGRIWTITTEVRISDHGSIPGAQVASYQSKYAADMPQHNDDPSMGKPWTIQGTIADWNRVEKIVIAPEPDTCPAWHTKALQVLDRVAEQHFAAWLATKPGQKWSKQLDSKRKSPHMLGFHLPSEHADLTGCLAYGDETRAKELMMHFRAMGYKLE